MRSVRADAVLCRKGAYAAVLLLALCGPASAQQASGNAGIDASTNPPSLSGLTLLRTIPQISGSQRQGYLIQAQCAAGLTVVLDKDGTDSATIIVLAGGASDGAQGGSLDMAGMPHTGRIRIYSSSSGCQYAARTW